MVEAIKRQVSEGTLFVTPSSLNAEVAAELCRRFPMDMVRFTNSGTEATMDALRLARAFTKREKIVKIEGCYHGHHDLVMISVKPPLDEAGPADDPTPVPYFGGITAGTVDEVIVIPYNDLPALGAGVRGPPRRDRRLHPGAGAREHGHRPARRRLPGGGHRDRATDTAPW